MYAALSYVLTTVNVFKHLPMFLLIQTLSLIINWVLIIFY